nr:MAG TPA: hypothetical protein [Caudoviricetes sp.]
MGCFLVALFILSLNPILTLKIYAGIFGLTLEGVRTRKLINPLFT